MTETQKRIKAYKKALPFLKERVGVVALLFIMSITMVGSATFAWITLSRAPEINGLATTIASNGNLEIALSDLDGKVPDETKIGDGSGNVTQSNLTWGNLINLSDESYGLSNIVLRPAALNVRTLATSPMYTVKYDGDGRVSGYFNDFSYTNYVKDKSGNWAFIPESTAKYGVRAISTVTYGDIGGATEAVTKAEAITDSLRAAQTSFNSIYNLDSGTKAETYMSTVGSLVGVHVDYTLNGGSPDCTQYIENLYKLMCDFKDVTVQTGELIVDISNLYLFFYNRDAYNAEPYTFDDLVDGTLTEASLWEKCKEAKADTPEIQIPTMSTFKTAWKKVAGYDSVLNKYESLPAYSAANYSDPVTKAKSIYGAYEVIESKWLAYEKSVLDGAPTTVTWDDWLRMATNQLCNMDTATIRANNGKDYTPEGLVKLKNDMAISELTPFLSEKNDFYATIHDGALKDVDQLLQCNLYVPKSDAVRISASVDGIPLLGTVNINMSPNISTALDEEPALEIDIVAVKEEVSTGDSGYKGDAVAAETYAMVMDLWIRTNANSSLLKLEGEVIYDQKMGTDENGNVAGPLYMWNEPVEDGEPIKTEIYENNGSFFYNNSSETTTTVPVAGSYEIIYEDKPSGYEGENRVWEEMDTDEWKLDNRIPDGSIATTQGSGSCYIFYPASPEDQEQCLKLLSAMRVAFVDEAGTLLARAELKPELAIENAGRVIVPLMLRANAPIEVDENGAVETFYITPLEQNEATRITSIVYLDGSNLYNSDVLSAGSITGQLNIQFGTTETELAPMEDKEVMSDYYEFEFSPYNKEFDENTQDLSMELSLILRNGTQPTSVKGNFVSVINSSQGARQPQFIMERQGETNEWKANVPFTGPGNYKLLSIQINGVDYILDDDKIVSVTIPGTSVTRLVWKDGFAENTRQELTAESYYEQELDLTLNSSKGTPDVRGVFLGDNGQSVTINFTSDNGTNYSGKGMFNASGKYSMTYVYIDDVITPLKESQYKILDLQLGLKARVGHTAPYIDADVTEEQAAQILEMQTNTSSACAFKYNCAEPLNMNVWCVVTDDQNNEIPNLTGVELHYTTGSDKNKLTAEMTWNPDTQRYEGTFQITKNGRYVFEQLIVADGDVVNVALSSPVISSNSPEPMVYQGILENHQTKVVDFSDNVKRNLSIALKKADSAVMNITVRHNGVDYTFTNVTPTEGDSGENVFTVDVSKAEGYSVYDGVWSIVAAEVSSVTYDGVFYDGVDPETGWLDLTPMFAGHAPITTEFINTIYVTVNSPSAKDNLIEFKDVPFMTQNKVNDITVTVKDYQGKPFDTFTSVTVDVEYKHGGYNSNVIADTPDPVGAFVENKPLENGIVTLPELVFMVDGKYLSKDVTFSLVLNTADGKTVTAPKISLPSVSVTWSKPDVIFVSTVPAVGQSFTTTQGNKSNSISSDKHTLTAYFNYVASDGCDNMVADNYPTEAVAQLNNAGRFKSATLTISSNMVYSFAAVSSGNVTATTTVGKGGNNKNAEIVGNASATSIVLEYDGVSYTVDLEQPIYVNNPY